LKSIVSVVYFMQKFETTRLNHIIGMWSRSRRLCLETVSRRTNVSSRPRALTSRAHPCHIKCVLCILHIVLIWFGEFGLIRQYNALGLAVNSENSWHLWDWYWQPNQSCPWVHFVWPDPTQPISWLTQPITSGKIWTHPSTTNNGEYRLVVTYFYTKNLSCTLVNQVYFIMFFTVITHIKNSVIMSFKY